MDSCLRGRKGLCCFGISNSFGAHLVGLVIIFELCWFTFFFAKMLGHGEFDIMVFAYFDVALVRTLFYIQMCCDSISRRRNYMYALLGSTIVEACLWVSYNIAIMQGIDYICEDY